MGVLRETMAAARSKLGYLAAALTVAAAVLVPFLLTSLFTRGVAATGVHIDKVYTGGAVARTLHRFGYDIDVHEAVYPHALQRERPYVQFTWRPAAALPPRVVEEIDYDNDGRPDLRVAFDVPRDREAPLRADVEPLDARFEALHGVSRERFSGLIARVNDTIVVRVPLRTTK